MEPDSSSHPAMQLAHKAIQAAAAHPTPTGVNADFWRTLVTQSCMGDRLAKWCLDFGRSWSADRIRPYKGRKGRAQECFANAGNLALENSELVYVEGYACTTTIPLPLHHAWLTDADGAVIDTTWSHGVSYCGVPVRTSALQDILEENGRWGVFGMSTPAWVTEDPQRVLWKP